VKNWLKKIFRGVSGSTFQTDVLQILQDSFPDGSFKTDRDSFAISAGQMQFSLKQLQREISSADSMSSQVVRHFASILGAKPMINLESTDGEKVSSRILPWFVPPSSSGNTDWVLKALHHGILIGYCVENETSRTPITHTLLQKWGIDSKLIHEKSILNLKRFRDFKLEVEGPEPFIGIELKDGHDAVRLLLGEVREFAATKLGEPFFAGIPSRDFLILWSMKCSPHFHEFVQEKINDDYAASPFSLTKAKFQATRYSIDPL
jgi:hypothetical protein